MSNDENGGRERGILTKADIQYLREGGEDMSDGAEFNTRRRVVQRAREALLDFTILLDHMNDTDLEKVTSLEGSHPDRERMLDGMRDALALIYHGTKDNPEPFDFETRLEGGVNRARRREFGGRHHPVDTTFEVEELPISTLPEIFERVERGDHESMSEGELRAFARALFESDHVPNTVYRTELADSWLDVEDAAETVEKMQETMDRAQGGFTPMGWVDNPSKDDEES